VDTEKPMNPGDFDERIIDPSMAVEIPPEKFVPRSREKAEHVSRKKTPKAEDVLVAGWHEGKGEDPDAAVKAVKKARDPEALG
jgi:hypothetical protein